MGSPSAVPPPITDRALANLPADEQAARAWALHLSRNDSEVTSMFCGQLQSRICCLSCGNASYCFDPFFDLSVPIPFGRKSAPSSVFIGDGGGEGTVGGGGEGGRRTNIDDCNTGGGQQSSSTCTVEDCLRAFTREEALDGDNRPVCSACRQRQKSVKSLAVHRFPPVLVIHLKRFQYDSSNRDKIGTPVDFPISGLDLAPFSTPRACISLFAEGQGWELLSGDCVYSGLGEASYRGELSSRGWGGSSSDMGGSEGGRGRETPRRDSPRKSVFSPSPIYELYGVCNHMGGLEGGHYTAHCRGSGSSSDGSGSTWNTFDDARVSRVNPARVGGSAAYVLFYRLKWPEERDG